MTNLFVELVRLPNNGVYVIRNDLDKRVLVVGTLDIPGSIGRLVGQIRDNDTSVETLKRDVQKIGLEIVESNFDDPRRLKLRTNYWIDYYKKLGYSLYVETKNRLTYKTSYDLKLGIGCVSEVALYLVSRRYEKIQVGSFKSFPECEAFIALYYKAGVYDLVFSSYDLEKSYRKNNGLKV